MRDVFIKRFTELAHKDKNLILITGDLGFGVLDDFEKELPKQYINVGVAEQNMTSIAAGLALEGKTVFTYSIANFPTLRCLEQIRNDACYHNLNVNVVSIGGGFSYGALGASHHATEDLAILRALPNMTSVAPTDNWEVLNATDALVNKQGPGFLRLDKDTPGFIENDGEIFELGKARVTREGSDITFIVAGGIMTEVIKAADILAEKGIEARIVSMHTISSMDRDVIRNAALQTGGIVTVEEHNRNGGLGGAVAEICMDENIRPDTFIRMGLNGKFTEEVGDQYYLRNLCGLDAASIAQTVLANKDKARMQA